MGRKRFNPCGEFERYVLDSKNGELWGKYLSFDNAMKRFVRNISAIRAVAKTCGGLEWKLS